MLKTLYVAATQARTTSKATMTHLILLVLGRCVVVVVDVPSVIDQLLDLPGKQKPGRSFRERPGLGLKVRQIKGF
jgi:hypothetical protein